MATEWKWQRFVPEQPNYGKTAFRVNLDVSQDSATDGCLERLNALSKRFGPPVQFPFNLNTGLLTDETDALWTFVLVENYSSFEQQYKLIDGELDFGLSVGKMANASLTVYFRRKVTYEDFDIDQK